MDDGGETRIEAVDQFAAHAQVAQRQNDRMLAEQFALLEQAEAADALEPGRQTRIGAIVEKPQHRKTGGQRGVGHDDGVSASTDNQDGVVVSGHQAPFPIITGRRCGVQCSGSRRAAVVYDSGMSAAATTESIASRPVRIGAVSYLNARPLVEGLEKCRDAALSFDVPSRLLGALLEERADVALAPIVDALQSPEPLAVMPVGCIASDGATRSVKVFSRVPLGEIKRLLVDPDSKTSVALATILLRRLHGASPEIMRAPRPIVEALDIDTDTDGALMIGDKVERHPPAADAFPYAIDLGEAWHGWTGLPFVYAAWVCQASRGCDPIVRRARELLDRQRRHNRTRLGWVAHRRAAEHGWSPFEAHAYLKDTIRTALGERERAAIERFAQECAAAGLIDADRRVVWAS